MALDGDEAGLGRATSDRLEQYISEMLRRPDVGDQVRCRVRGSGGRIYIFRGR